MIYILCQHRSGSTWLLNIIGSSQSFYAFPEELNIKMPFPRYFQSAYWKFKTNKEAKAIPDNIVGSFWRDPEKLKYDPTKVLELSKLYIGQRDLDINQFLTRLTIDHRSQKQKVVCKYPLHPFYWKDLLRTESKLIILHRDISEVLLSKLNDARSKELRKSQNLKWYIYKYLILFSSCIENVFLYSFSRSEEVLFVQYKNLVGNDVKLRNSLSSYIGHSDLDFSKRGKDSSHDSRVNKYELTLFDMALVKLTRWINDNILR